MFFFLFLLRIVLLNAENNFEIIYTAFSEDNFDKEGWHLQNSYSTTLFRKCGNETVFGGFSAFSNTLITYNSSLPPHYQIYASFLFWKIDSWNKEEKECVLIYFDDKLKKECFSVEQDYQLCGTFSEADFDKKVIFDIQMIHSSKNIFIIITSNLNQGAENESWGINNFKIEILKCPKGCVYCQDDIMLCDFWIHVKSFWQTPSEFDGWKIDDTKTLSPSVCAGLNIAGGYPNLKVNQTIENTIFNLSSHFNVQVEFKLWLFGIWKDDQFILKLDDYELLNEHINQSAHLINCGGIQQNVTLINLRAQMNHSQSSMKITFKTQSNSTLIKYWGINAFDLYIGKCSINCEQCYGPGYKECTACIQDWVIFKGECIYYNKIPPLTCNHISIVQQLQNISNNIHQIQLKSDQIGQETLKLGENEIEFDLNMSIFNLEIQAQCQKNIYIYNSIQIYIRCYNQQQYIFTFSCQENLPTIILKTNLHQKFEQTKQFLLNLNKTSVELYQLVIMEYQQTQLLILSLNLIWI
ncbi:unnamed protein product [Paramecium pentaurelia]|uniref:Uncharacterized protein n=1 Tax=Paramecium pentaurelia TaxID=43138 RepID=A0A8S1YHT4_9CILI|nr:unnamed protein product [Paramecium pentaurelia]